MVSPLDALPTQHLTAAFVIAGLQNLFRLGLLDVTATIIKKGTADMTTEYGTKCDPSWIEPVIRDFIERGYLTVLRSQHRSGMVGWSTTRLDDIDFDKARLRINSSILHAHAIPQSPQLVNNNHGEQFFGHASKFEENHYGDMLDDVVPPTNTLRQLVTIKQVAELLAHLQPSSMTSYIKEWGTPVIPQSGTRAAMFDLAVIRPTLERQFPHAREADWNKLEASATPA